MKISDRVMIPQDLHPEINFVGLLIGPRGNTLKMLEKETGAKVRVHGSPAAGEKCLKLVEIVTYLRCYFSSCLLDGQLSQDTACRVSNNPVVALVRNGGHGLASGLN